MLSVQVVHLSAHEVDADLVEAVGSWREAVGSWTYETHAADVLDADVDRILGVGVARFTADNPRLVMERRAAVHTVRPG